MLIWRALILPVIACVVLLFGFQKKVVWWEFAIPFAIALITISICHVAAIIGKTSDTEYWTGWATEAKYYEDWNEYIHRICAREVCFGSGENRSCTTEIYDCSYVDYHPEYWEVHESNGLSLRIPKWKFCELVKQWGNQQFIDLHGHYHTNDGDMYKTTWNQEYASMEVVTTSHSYTNKVQASDSIFKFPDISKNDIQEYGLFSYPQLRGYDMTSLLGYNGKDFPAINDQLNKINATIGASKQVRIFLLLFKNKPIDASLKQEWLWKWGNKNKFVITVGVDDDFHVQWANDFSWSESEEAKALAKNLFLEYQHDKLDIPKILPQLEDVIIKYYKRKEFKDFDYLEIEPGTLAIILTYIITAISVVGASVICVKNDIDEPREERRKWPTRRF